MFTKHSHSQACYDRTPVISYRSFHIAPIKTNPPAQYSDSITFEKLSAASLVSKEKSSTASELLLTARPQLRALKHISYYKHTLTAGYQVLELYSACRCLYYQHAVDRSPHYGVRGSRIIQRTILVGYACWDHSTWDHSRRG